MESMFLSLLPRIPRAWSSFDSRPRRCFFGGTWIWIKLKFRGMIIDCSVVECLAVTRASLPFQCDFTVWCTCIQDELIKKKYRLNGVGLSVEVCSSSPRWPVFDFRSMQFYCLIHRNSKLENVGKRASMVQWTNPFLSIKTNETCLSGIMLTWILK